MAGNMCPICEIEMTNNHRCVDYDVRNFSIELELLDLPFSLEPYGPVEEPLVSRVVEDDEPAKLTRSFEVFSMNKKPAPLFLRL